MTNTILIIYYEQTKWSNIETSNTAHIKFGLDQTVSLLLDPNFK